ncbi:MAG: hypothetical protein PUF66_00910 [Clostridium sp.]|nr:hypothetical protein [Clostridium sp.]
MTLKEVNYEVERLTNQLNKLLNEKESLESIVGLHSTSYDKIIVDGGKVVDKMLEYQILKEMNQLDFHIQIIQEKIKNNMDWIDNELKILKKYDKIEQLIIYYKEIDTKNYTWYQISSKVNYSMSQCKRIYSRYKKKRNV